MQSKKQRMHMLLVDVSAARARGGDPYRYTFISGKADDRASARRSLCVFLCTAVCVVANVSCPRRLVCDRLRVYIVWRAGA